VPLILYGIVAQQMNVGDFALTDLFLAGLLPALLMIVLLSVWTIWTHRGGEIPKTVFTGPAVWEAAKAARWELPLPLIVLGGIYSGYFAISEAAAITAVYVTIAQVWLYREVSLRELPTLIRDAMIMVGGIILILGVALAFTTYLIDAEVPQAVFEFTRNHVESKYAFLMVLNIMLLVLGAMLDIFAALAIVVPLILPVAIGYGIDPVHLGIIFLANMQIGYFTPPIGMNLFIASYRFNKPITELYVASWPFMVVLLVALLLITYIPGISLWLVHWAG
jgi:tripartite ATP-independent transporter DctM subunit